MRYALIQSGTVANVVEQDSLPTVPGLWVACGNAGPGWTYNGSTFADPNAPAPVVPPSWASPTLDARYHHIDVGPFFDRFGAKALNVTGSTDPQVQGLVTLLLPRKFVDLKRADLPGMLDVLVSKSLITVADKAVILNPITTDYERYVKGMIQPV